MKLEINLLPPDFQADHARQLYGRGVGLILRRLITGLGLVATMFAGAYVTLQMIVADTDVTNQDITRGRSVDPAVLQTNETIQAIETRLTSSLPWMPQVNDVLAALPAELTLTTMAVSNKTKDLSITGTSRNRAAVVTFEQAVKALPWVASVESPLQNFATGATTSFTLIIKRQEVRL